jgi:dienelactone hydrolase
MKTRVLLIAMGVLLMSLGIQAKIVTKDVVYKDGDTTLEGFLAYDDSMKGPRPGVLVVHAWMGLGEQVKRRCRMLAEMGYVAFAADVYGKGVRPSTRGEAAKLAGGYKADRPLLRRRVRVALEQLAEKPRVDPGKLAAIGYCFGGTAVLELARSGADVRGTVSFHGGLDSLHPEDARNIKGRVLVLHGADDPTISAADEAAFRDELRKAAVDWEMVYYGGAVHSFTDPYAGHDNSKGAAYNARADEWSWRAMRTFLQDLFR